MASFVINEKEFRSLSKPTQQEIMKLFFRNDIVLSDDSNDQGELTKKHLNEIITGLSEKSRNVLKAIASFNTNKVLLNDLLAYLEVEYADIKGVWSGITTRSRNVTQDPEFLLFEWVYDDQEDSHVLKFHPNTYTHLVNFFS